MTEAPVSSRTAWSVRASIVSKRTINPIRAIVDNLKVAPNPQKQMISLALGDPTIYGNFDTDSAVTEAVIKQLQTYRSNGYPPSTGYEASRAAVAKRFSTSEVHYTSKDVVIASGCSGALDLAIGAIANPGQNILIPRPGFSLYATLATSKDIEIRYYDLLPDRNWEVNLDHLKNLINENTAALLINNPSNPCGSNFTKSHLLDILALCERYHLPIISDEIYEHLVFSGNTFYPLASLTKSVPILTVGGIAKKYLVPGWRVGWVVVYDPIGVLGEVREGLVSLSQLILGSCSIIQAALHDILLETPNEFYTNTISQLEKNAKLCATTLSSIAGLHVIIPQGAMYMMVGINISELKDIKSDIDFSEKLVAEESVLVLPGQCFQFPNYFRIVITSPTEKLEEACGRIAEFCARHHV